MNILYIADPIYTEHWYAGCLEFNRRPNDYLYNNSTLKPDIDQPQNNIINHLNSIVSQTSQMLL